MGGYTVRVGDTLSGLAAQAGVSTTAMAQMNGLDPDAFLLAGTVIKLPTGAPAPARSDQPAPATVVAKASPVSDAGCASTPGRSRHRRSEWRAAIAGHGHRLAGERLQQRHDRVANARGIMQVIPASWDYVQHT